MPWLGTGFEEILSTPVNIADRTGYDERPIRVGFLRTLFPEKTQHP